MGRRRGESLGTLGDLGGNLESLRRMKRSLAGDDSRVVETERWGTLGLISGNIATACEERDLVALASAARDLKNRLRRPSIRRALAESEEKKSQNGGCRCSRCSVVISGSREPCVEGALCTKCALKNQEVSPARKAERAARKNAAKAGTPSPGAQAQSSSQGGEQDTEKNESVGIGLRRRGYAG